MPSIDGGFVSALLASERLDEIFANKIDKKMFLEPYNKIFDKILEHFYKYGSIPSRELIEKEFKITLEEHTDTLLFYCGELKLRQKFNDTQLLAKQIYDAYATADTSEKKRKAIEKIEEAVHSLSAKFTLELSAAQTIDITENPLARVAELRHRQENPILGIPYPWKPLQDETMGAQPGDMITFLGTSGLGKTWALMICGAYASVMGYSVLVCTHEMTIRQLGFRFDALLAGIPFDALRKASLDPFSATAYEIFLQTLDENKKAGKVKPFIINQGSPSDGGRALSALARSIKPDLMIIDGAYLFSESYSWDKVSELTKLIKTTAILNNIPIIVSNQYSMNKMNATKSSFSASFINDSNTVIKMVREDEKKYLPIMGFQIMKGRDISVPDMSWVTNWDFEAMDFKYRPDLVLDEFVFGGSSSAD